jgi:frizzled protein 1/7
VVCLVIIIFEKSEVQFARKWVLTWSALCFSSTLFTVLTFLVETSRFRYPERPIIFLSACYMFVALAYLIGSSQMNSNSIVCKPLKNGQMNTEEFLVQGVEQISCTILFMMIYFFGMSSSIWWVVLTLTWFLAAGLKWGHEAIENISSYFHLAAWTIPGVKLIVILWLQKVDADILSGVCFTGLRDINLMRGFILVPLFFYLIIGSFFLLAGFISLFRIRIVMKHEGNKTDKLEKFMVRICIFSILYMVPAIIVICCYFYEQSTYIKWVDYWLKKNAIEFNLQPDYVTSSLFENDRSSLVFSLFMVKYAMLLVVGITSGFWIWSHKTISSWQRFFARIVNCCSSLNPRYKNEAAV